MPKINLKGLAGTVNGPNGIPQLDTNGYLPNANYPRYDVAGGCAGKPSASQKILIFKVSQAFVLKAGLPTSQAFSAVAATASTTFNIQKNGSTIGTIIWAISGTVPTFTLASDTSFAIGDTLMVIAPSSADTTLADIGITLQGFLT